jgi:hypothetical protein
MLLASIFFKPTALYKLFTNIEKTMKHTFTVATLYGLLLVTQAHAEAPPLSKPFQFYMGVAGGIETMAGKRSESLDEDNQNLLPPLFRRIITSYTSNLSMSERSGIGSMMTGFLWKIPNVPLLIGPEIYIGRGSTASSFSDMRLDPLHNVEIRYYTTDFQRKLFSGILIRAGYQFCEKYLAYLSFGFDRSQFCIIRTLRHEAAVPTTMVKSTKTLNGIVFGLGLERTFDQFVVGFDFKAIQYRTYNSIDNVQVNPGVRPAFFNFSVQPKIKMFSLRIAYRF